VTLYGSDDRAKEVLSMYKALTNTLLPFKLSLSGLKMSHRATWIAQLDNGAILQLGSGDEASVTQRTNDFLKTLPAVNERLAKSLANLEFADLRHKDGYAIRLKGVTTDFLPAQAGKKI
jgi:cell division protein FtsQ